MTLKVLYITAWGRSGTTLLGNMLNECHSCIHVGEISQIWDCGMLNNRPCGCGKPFHSCEFWNAVFLSAFGGMESRDAMSISRLRVKPKNLQLFTTHMFRRGRTEIGVHPDLLSWMGELYRSVSRVSQCGVIVDSSKSPAYGFVLKKLNGVSLDVVHMVRDPRAVAYSWQRNFERDDYLVDGTTAMERKSFMSSTVRWVLWNLLAERVLRPSVGEYIRLRYEDLVESPHMELKKLSRILPKGLEGLLFSDSRKVQLGRNHTVMGNPNRTKRGDIIIESDNQWRCKLPSLDRILVTAVGAPFIIHYGYRMWPRDKRNETLP